MAYICNVYNKCYIYIYIIYNGFFITDFHLLLLSTPAPSIFHKDWVSIVLCPKKLSLHLHCAGYEYYYLYDSNNNDMYIKLLFVPKVGFRNNWNFAKKKKPLQCYTSTPDNAWRPSASAFQFFHRFGFDRLSLF